MSKKRKLPPIGSLVRLRSYAESVDFVKVESTIDRDTVRDFPVGTLALIVEHLEHPDDTSSSDPMLVPVILVDGFAGWVFNDEWTPLPRAKRTT